MRGEPQRQLAMLTTLSPEELIPAGHPIRRIRAVVEVVLADLDGEFDAMYSRTGRPSVPPEHLLKATVLMALYSIRSERAFCERLNYDLLFKWFLDLPIDARAFDATTFTKNRQRLLSHEIADRFFALVVAQAKLRRYVSSEHFSVDGTLLEAWASHKSFRPKDGSDLPPSAPGRNSEVDYRGQRRSNQTHQSATDPEARLARKSQATAAKLCYATGFAERDAALGMLSRLPARAGRRTVAGDKGYDSTAFVAEVRDLGFTPHFAPNTTRQRSTIDGRTTRHAGHQVNQRIRKRIEEPFGWMKTIAGGRKLRYIGKRRNRAWFLLTGAIYNIIRIAALDHAPA